MSKPDDHDGESPTPSSRRTILLIVGGVVALVLVIVAVVLVTTRTPSSEGGGSATATASSTAGPSVPATVPSDSPATAPPVAITDPATAAPGVTVTVTGVEAVQGEAVLPGDVAGPSVRFVVTIRNGTAADVPLSVALVNVYYGTDRKPASDLSQPGGVPFPATVAAGGEASGTFIFTVPAEQRDNVLITLDYQADAPVVALEGALWV